MNLMRKPINLEINGKEYEMLLDFESAIAFEDLYGKSIFFGINNIIENQDLKALGCLIGCCVKENGVPVGMEILKGMDVLEGITFFTEKITELMSNSLPEEDDNSKKSQKKTKEN